MEELDKYKRPGHVVKLFPGIKEYLIVKVI